jgi:hypothetical protein
LIKVQCVITKDEIFKGIKNLKNNKAFGDDQVINEYMKTTRLMHDALDFFYENFCHEQFSQGEKINALIGNVARKTLFTTI